MKNKDVPENKGIFLHGFRHNKTDKVNKDILIACDSDELYQNHNLFNSWCNNFINKVIEMRDFKKTEGFFMTLVKRNNFIKIESIGSLLNTIT